MNDVTNLPTEELVAPKPTRAQILEKARAAKAAKVADRAAAKEDAAVSAPVPVSNGMHFWEAAFIAAMHNFQVRAAQGVSPCAAIADRALEVWNQKMESMK